MLGSDRQERLGNTCWIAWGRDLRPLVNTVHDLTMGDIGLKVLTGEGATIDTTTPAGKLIFGIFATCES